MTLRKCKCGEIATNLSRGRCKKCDTIYNKEYFRRNKEKMNIYSKMYNEKYYLENKGRAKKRREKNKERIEKYRKEYYEENKERIKKDKIRRNREYYRKNKELMTSRKRAYYNTEKGRAVVKNSTNKRQARKTNGSNGSINSNKLVDLLKKQNYECVLCEIHLDQSINKFVHLDHITPLAKGGKHIIENVQYLCYKCNISKSDKILI